jgi:hypothetical protein
MGMCRFPIFLLQTIRNIPPGMGRSRREEINYSEKMRARNLFADAKFAKLKLLEFSDAGLRLPNDALPLNDIRHECIHCMRDQVPLLPARWARHG